MLMHYAPCSKEENASNGDCVTFASPFRCNGARMKRDDDEDFHGDEQNYCFLDNVKNCG